MPQVQKVIEYRRAKWFESGQNLEELCRLAWRLKPSQVERTFEFEQRRSISGLSAQDFGRDGFGLHCGRYTDQQPAGVIKMEPAPAVSISKRPPANDENFLSGDFFALVRKNDVICLGCGRNGSALRNYLAKLFIESEFVTDSAQFELLLLPNAERVKEIDRIGVRKVDLKLALSVAAATETSEEGAWSRVSSGGKKFLSAVFRREADFRRIQEIEDGTLSIMIDVKKGELTATRGFMERFSKEIAYDDEAEDFDIHLQDGNIISKHSATMRKKVYLEEVANSVSSSETWQSMIDYLREVRVV